MAENYCTSFYKQLKLDGFSPLTASLLVVSKTNTFNILLLKYSPSAVYDRW